MVGERSIVHLNVADFAVAVERTADPGLRSRPVIVAPPGSPRARVYDMSEEAFRAGVRKGMPLARALRLCRDARLLPPRPGLYRRAMAALARMALRYTPLVEAEEASGHLYLDLTGTGRLWGPPRDVARRLHREVRTELGLDPIWTLAANKLVAKAASRLVKPSGELLVPLGEEECVLEPLPLELLPGLERDDLLRLREFNLFRVGQAARWRVEHLAVVFGARAAYLHRLFHGRDDTPVLPPERRPAVLRLGHEFTEETERPREVHVALYGLAERAGAGLRRMGRVARRVGVEVEYADGMRSRGWCGHRDGTALDRTLFETARVALGRAWRRRVRLRRLWLSCSRLGPPPPVQAGLPFTPHDDREQRHVRLQEALDRIRERFGPRAVLPGLLLER